MSAVRFQLKLGLLLLLGRLLPASVQRPLTDVVMFELEAFEALFDLFEVAQDKDVGGSATPPKLGPVA